MTARADAPELLALVEAAKDALTVLEEYNMGLSSPVICDLVAALAAWESNLHLLRGHDLCCWCKPGQPCHADVLLRLANEGEGE